MKVIKNTGHIIALIALFTNQSEAGANFAEQRTNVRNKMMIQIEARNLMRSGLDLKFTHDEDEDENICLLTNEVLDENKITLPCNHSFNFVPLYKEICNQKKNANNLEICKVKYNQIKCPYCRQIHDVLLPHIKLTNAINFISGVNTPANLCMKFHTCEWKMKSGKNKGQPCKHFALLNNDGYCGIHKKQE